MFNILYKYFMLLHCSFVAIFWVYRISFESKPSYYVVLIEFYLDIVFTVDILRIFISPFMSESGKLVTDKKLIAKRYLQSWLLADLFCNFPLALFRYNSNRADGGYNE